METKHETMTEDLQAPKNNFFVSLNGEIESAHFPFYQDVYCKYTLVSGPDWIVTSGIEEGISQIAKKGYDEEQSFVWNLPLSIIYKSSNPFGCEYLGFASNSSGKIEESFGPQLVISAYGLDPFGNDVVRGYGVVHVPVSPGHSKASIPMFVPESSTAVQKFTSWLTGKRPEFVDPRILTQSDSREVARVKSEGSVTVVFDTTIRGLMPLGYIYSH